MALLKESEEFQEAVRNEFGHWPFAYGLKRRHKEALAAFATTFARCSEAPWTTRKGNDSRFEIIFEALQKCATAQQNHFLNVTRATHLEKSGSSQQEVKKSTGGQVERVRRELQSFLKFI
eukprot:2373290-Karenia_brevis.AAC.1